jgi:RimJ/RimL family protein N-acetyltransferase
LSEGIERKGSAGNWADYFLRTERLGFRCWSDADEAMALAMWGDAEVRRWTGGPLSPEQARARLRREIANQKAHGIQYWPVFLLATGEHIGSCGMRPYKPSAAIHELGFGFFPAHWGRGLATEAARAAIEQAFGPVGAAALFAGHHPENEASRHVLGKLGFQYTHDEFYPPTGKMHPSYILTAESWRASRK